MSEPRTPRETRIFLKLRRQFLAKKHEKKAQKTRETRIFLQIWCPNFPNFPEFFPNFPENPKISPKIPKNGQKWPWETRLCAVAAPGKGFKHRG